MTRGNETDANQGKPLERANRARSEAPEIGLTELVVAAFSSVALAAAIDLVRATLTGTARVSPWAFATATFQLLAMLLPAAPLLALALWCCLRLARAVSWLAPVRSRLRLGKRIFAPDPAGFAGGLGAVAFAASTIALGTRGYSAFEATFHRADLAAAAFGIALGAVLAASLFVAALVSVAARAAAPVIGRLGSVATVVVVALGLATAGAARTLTTYPELITTYGAARLASPALVTATFAACALATRLAARRGVRFGALALGLSLASVVGLVVTAYTYDRSQAARSVVEQRTVSGSAALRAWVRLTDRDGDGFSAAFGGGDCDNGDASVYPGAADPRGDGVDADCFGGDGTPAVTPLADGRFAQRRLPLASPSFLVITVDALRPDAIDAAGAPRMARLLAESVSFPTTTAQSSRSIRSIPSMWTGLYPSQIAYGSEFQFPALLDENVTVAEQLAASGYATAAVIGTNYFARSRGFVQGFERVHQDFGYQPSPVVVTDRALTELRELAAGAQPWLLWVHLFNVHAPHRNATLHPDAENPYADAYAQEVALADQQVGRLLDAVAQLDASGRTVVILASDHGEAAGEHEIYGHSTSLYDVEVRAVLAAHVPGVAPRVVDAPVALMDVAPTVLDLAGARMPVPTPAESLVPLMTGEREPDRSRHIVTELLPDGHYPWDIKAIRRGDDKLIWWVREGRHQLFDLAADPHELTDLADVRRDDARELLGLLRAWSATAVREEHRRDVVVAQARLAGPPERMSHPLDLRIPGVGRLLGLELPRTRLSPGDTIPLELFWEVEHDTDRDLYFELGAFWPPGSPPGPGAFHGSHYPVYAQYHTNEWQPGEVLRDPVQIIVPPEIFRGPVRFDFWITEGGSPVPFVFEGRIETRITLFEIEIE